jgi:hypothetical protein
MKNIWRQHKKLPPDQNLMAEKFLFFDCLLDGEQFKLWHPSLNGKNPALAAGFFFF